MSFLSYFLGKRTQSASIAKERLKITLAHERAGRGHAADYLPALKEELLAVIEKYVHIERDQITVNLESHDDYDVLELNVVLPELQQGKKVGVKVQAQGKKGKDIRAK